MQKTLKNAAPAAPAGNIYIYINIYKPLSTLTPKTELVLYPPLPPPPPFKKNIKNNHKHGGETSCVKFMVNKWELGHYPPMG